MIYNTLICHPNTPCSEVQHLSVEIVNLPGKGLHFTYYLQGNIKALRIPELQTPSRIDGLWEKTCFEIFVATENDTRYQEFNFSPSGQWAVYAFTKYRERDVWHSHHPYKISVECSDYDLLLHVVVPLADLPCMASDNVVQLGLTAVIETIDGQKSYWALNHPSDTPDFHHWSGFVCNIEPNSF